MKKTGMLIMLTTMMLVLSGCKEKKQNVINQITVQTTSASESGVATGQSYSGTIEEESGTSLSFAGAGTIKSLNVDEGQFVSKGQLLGVINASSTANAVTMAHASTLQAQEALHQAQDAYTRMKMLHDNGSLPEIKWVEVETKVSQAKQMVTQTEASEKIARKGLTDARLLAPFSGYISKKIAEIGQNIIPGQAVATLVNIDKVKVKISVPENEIAKLKVGQRITFRTSSLAGMNFYGIITEKSVDADIISRSYTVKATVENSNHKLLPGMVCDVYANIQSNNMSIQLPSNIIQIDFDNRTFVWTVENGIAKKTFVVLGDNVGDNVSIKSGLQLGDQVIVSGQQKVSSGMKVKVENVK